MRAFVSVFTKLTSPEKNAPGTGLLTNAVICKAQGNSVTDVSRTLPKPYKILKDVLSDIFSNNGTAKYYDE